jgi:hypothetical protein
MYGYVGVIYVNRLSADKTPQYCRFGHLCPSFHFVLMFVLRDYIRFFYAPESKVLTTGGKLYLSLLYFRNIIQS